MHLHIDEHGEGPKVAVLLHGMMGSSSSWWRLVPALLESGYRVLALDLPGHGLSDRDPESTVERAADAILSSLKEADAEHPTVAMGHSFGGLLLAAAAPQLSPSLAVYVDAPLRNRGGWDRAEAIAAYETDRQSRTAAQLRISHPHYSVEDCEIEAIAAQRFDPLTAAAIAAGRGSSWLPEAGSVVISANPSRYLTDDDVAELRRSGVTVRDIAGAGHSVWVTHPDEFRAALPEVFA